MKKFHFSLDSLLQIRQSREDEEAKILGLATADCEKVNMRLKKIRDLQAQACNKEDAMQRDYLSMLLKEELVLKVKLVELEIVRKQKERLYLDARKDREVLSKLREKRQGEEEKRFKKKEIQNMDDIIQMNYGRKI